MSDPVTPATLPNLATVRTVAAATSRAPRTVRSAGVQPCIGRVRTRMMAPATIVARSAAELATGRNRGRLDRPGVRRSRTGPTGHLVPGHPHATMLTPAARKAAP